VTEDDLRRIAEWESETVDRENATETVADQVVVGDG
jgi:hypothetical protein